MSDIRRRMQDMGRVLLNIDSCGAPISDQLRDEILMFEKKYQAFLLEFRMFCKTLGEYSDVCAGWSHYKGVEDDEYAYEGDD